MNFFLRLLNDALTGHRVAVSASGALTITTTATDSRPGPEQQALARRLRTIAESTAPVTIRLVYQSPQTLVGNYISGEIDVGDIRVELTGDVPPRFGAAVLIHELWEQYEKQVNGQPFGAFDAGAHAAGIRAEEEVLGARREQDREVPEDRYPDVLVIETPYSFPDGTVLTRRAKSVLNNIIQSEWVRTPPRPK